MMKKVLIIGASGGIGSKVASILSKDYTVIGTYFKHPEKIEALPHIKSIHLDLQDKNSIKKLRDEIGDNIYAVINCAGVVDFEGNDIENDFAIWEKTIAINLSGNYYVAKILQDKLQENGRFIMISSTDSYFGGSITASYAASKSGVNSLTKSLSLLFSDKKIRVNSIAPGWVLTPMTEANGTEFLDKVAEINPLKRNAIPEDVSKLISFLLSDQADYINGQVISLEGGYTNQDPTLLLEEEGK
jgi:NAD(P)-dependent dehydrogenase (short-subunit alcohol dehydrogenase family)